ncbi:UDP-glucuronosyltransferase 2A1 [Bagarius yarrelli]|uniref:glucuronosyltransferase n=1 Tax=Bagarius yarrelli TaxID=175774 RepID=A0A556TYD8_BAGYA|nr:UDP-glucuronosyltransferase 2A1 [Bagarius yarrelli]
MSVSKGPVVCFLLLLGLSLTPPGTTAGKILVWPADFSHWFNMEVIIDQLLARGHNVTVVTHSASPSVKTGDQSPGYNVEIIEVPYTKKDVTDTFDIMFRCWINELPNDNAIQGFRKLKEILDQTTDKNLVFCRKLFARKDLLEKWTKEQFDVFLTDPLYMCRPLLALKLNLRLVVSLRFSYGSSIERLCGQLPTPASYIPAVGLGYKHRMTFFQRVKNLLFNFLQDFLFTFLSALKWNSFYTEVMAGISDSSATMRKLERAAFCFLFMLGLSQCTCAGKILIWPTEFSHWLNLKTIVDELIARGHNVTVVTHSATLSVKTEQSPGYSVDIVEVPYTKQCIINTLESMLKYWVYDMPNDNLIQVFLKMKKFIDLNSKYNQVMCRELFAREDLLEKWGKEQFDVLITDPLYICGELLAQKLNLPFIISLRFSFGNVIERLCGQLPAPTSFVPAISLGYTDQMDFPQRVKNFLFILFHDLVFELIFTLKWDNFFTEILAMRYRACICLLIPLMILPEMSLSGNVLVLPGEYSHWHNMRVIVEELMDRNHSVTVLTHSGSPTLKRDQNDRFSFMTFQVSMDKEEMDSLTKNLIHIWMDENNTGFRKLTSFWNLMSGMKRMVEDVCDGMFKKELVSLLKESHFDVLLYDPMMPCADLLADVLDLPFVLSLRISFAYTLERLCGQMPAPPSYVPAAATQGHLTDHMNFGERLENMLLYIVHTALVRLQTMLSFDKQLTKHAGKPTTLCETIGKADIWLIRTYWDFEYPRPLLPNFKFVGGLHCKPAKPLPKEMEDFVQTSGDEGIVVFSLGSMIKNLTKERADTIASALGQIPQKVLWRYTGEKPKTLAANTRLYDWIPQNDLLGHSKTKAFITHGGTNGIYEAIYHGVPMVGLPLFADQPDNINHMQTKGAAVMLDINKMESDDLKQALVDVINNPSYKENIMRLSRIHHDQPMKPLDQAVYWIEYVMRHKGAKHLRVEAHNLTWYQYHCLDVAAFLLCVIALAMFVFVKTCRWLFRKCCRKTSAKSKKE